MNAVRINSSPFKGEVGRGMGFSSGYFVDQPAVCAPSPPHPSNRKRRFRDLPLEGEGDGFHAIALALPREFIPA